VAQAAREGATQSPRHQVEGTTASERARAARAPAPPRCPSAWRRGAGRRRGERRSAPWKRERVERRRRGYAVKSGRRGRPGARGTGCTRGDGACRAAREQSGAMATARLELPSELLLPWCPPRLPSLGTVRKRYAAAYVTRWIERSKRGYEGGDTDSQSPSKSRLRLSDVVACHPAVFSSATLQSLRDSLAQHARRWRRQLVQRYTCRTPLERSALFSLRSQRIWRARCAHLRLGYDSVTSRVKV